MKNSLAARQQKTRTATPNSPAPLPLPQSNLPATASKSTIREGLLCKATTLVQAVHCRREIYASVVQSGKTAKKADITDC